MTAISFAYDANVAENNSACRVVYFFLIQESFRFPTPLIPVILLSENGPPCFTFLSTYMLSPSRLLVFLDRLYFGVAGSANEKMRNS